ncbi:MAG: hypothetical protein RBU37_05860 [Myxococcota bacterium]|jgi:TPR repeat protein|nr:hypothetical protein [Myxococcota bacterium]
MSSKQAGETGWTNPSIMESDGLARRMLTQDEGRVIDAINQGEALAPVLCALVPLRWQSWLELAQQRQAPACWLVGLHLEQSHGCVHELEHAPKPVAPVDAGRYQHRSMPWYLLAAEQQYAPAMYSIARLLERGLEEELDVAAAGFWLRRAAELGFAPAMCRLGVSLLEQQEDAEALQEAWFWLEWAARLGSAPAHLNLAACWSRGVGCACNNEQAAEAVQQAAELGHAGARCLLTASGTAEQRAERAEMAAQREAALSVEDWEDEGDDEQYRASVPPLLGPDGQPMQLHAAPDDWLLQYSEAEVWGLAEELFAASQSPLVSFEHLLSFSQLLTGACSRCSLSELNALLRESAKLMPSLSAERAAVLALLAGALVEAGAAPNLAYSALEERLLALLERLEQGAPSAAQVAEAALAFDLFVQPAIAMLSRDAALRAVARRGPLLSRLLVNQAQVPAARELVRLLQIADGLSVLLLDLDGGRGFWLRLSGVANLTQFQVLANDHLHRVLPWRQLPPGQRYGAEVLAVASGHSPRELALRVDAVWELYDARAMSEAGVQEARLLPDALAMSDVQTLRGVAVLFVRGSRRARSVQVYAPFPALTPSVAFERRTSRSEFEAWLQHAGSQKQLLI